MSATFEDRGVIRLQGKTKDDKHVHALVAALTVKMRDFILKLTTLAFGEAVAVIAFNIDYIGGANSFSGIPLYSTFTIVAVATAVTLYVAWRFDGSRLGFALGRRRIHGPGTG